MKTFRWAAAVFFASAIFATSASAELIKNGGFETGDLAEWEVSTHVDNFVGDDTFTSYVPFGSYALFIGCVDNLCSTSQSIATTRGQSYTFSFEYGSDGEIPNEFIAKFGNDTVFHQLDDGFDSTPGFTHKSFIVVANDTTTIVIFSGSNPAGYLALDNVSVEAIPEPGALALLLAGLAGLGMSRRQRQST